MSIDFHSQIEWVFSFCLALRHNTIWLSATELVLEWISEGPLPSKNLFNTVVISLNWVFFYNNIFIHKAVYLLRASKGPQRWTYVFPKDGLFRGVIKKGFWGTSRLNKMVLINLIVQLHHWTFCLMFIKSKV